MKAPHWWQTAVFYQIYPRCFADGNGDGIGDLAGMIAKLDYLRDLGIDALWLSPHYPSPLFDCSYDVADYTGVADENGTLAEFQKFLDGAHERGNIVILGWVLKHTPHRHPWFRASAGASGMQQSSARWDSSPAPRLREGWRPEAGFGVTLVFKGGAGVFCGPNA